MRPGCLVADGGVLRSAPVLPFAIAYRRVYMDYPFPDYL